MAYNYLCKFILIGDSAAGKTSIILQFTDRKFTSEYNRSIGLEHRCRNLDIAGKLIKFQILDTVRYNIGRSINLPYSL